MTDTHDEGDDPLRNADLGERTTVQTSEEIELTFMEPEEWYGSDKILGDQRVTDFRIEHNEYGEPRVFVEWERDLTKKLGRRWDRHDKPVTDAERKHERRRTWASRPATAVGILLPLGIALAIIKPITNNMAGFTINGESVAPMTFWDLAPAVVMIFGIAAFIAWALPRMPGMAGKTGGRSL